MDIATTTLSVGLNTLSRNDSLAWGVSSNEGHSFGAAVPDGTTDAQAFLAGFESILAEPSMTMRAIDLYCAHEGFATTLTAMQAAFPLVQVVPFTPTTTVGVLARAARRAAATALEEAGHGAVLLTSTNVDAVTGATDTAGAPAGRLLAASDGSAGFRRGHDLSGWGWVTSEGRYDSGTHPGSDVLSAELVAVHRLLKATPATRALTVLVDSKAALAVIDSIRSDTAARVAIPAGHDMHRIVGRIAARCADRDVRFEWVRGHSGHPLNEGADRLAVQARRHAQCGVAGSTRREVAARIATETVSAFRSVAAAA